MLDTASLKPCSVLFYWKKKLAKRGSFTNSIIHKFKTPNLNRSYRNIKQTLTEILSPISLKFFSFFSPQIISFPEDLQPHLSRDGHFFMRVLVTLTSHAKFEERLSSPTFCHTTRKSFSKVNLLFSAMSI